MHYYKFNISDWQSSTRHLSLEEEAIYFRLINYYYDTERPIPLETQSVFRRLMLVSHSVIALQILEEFFIKTEKGFVKNKCDQVIKEYKKLERKNKENGRKGGRPRADAARKETQEKPSGFPVDSQSLPSGNPNQELETINHKPETTKDNTSANASLVFDHWVMRMGKGSSTKLTKGRKSKIEARLKEGYSIDDIKQAIDGCANSGHHMGQNDTGTVYDDLTLICRNGEKVEWFKNNIAKVKPNEQVANQPKRASAVDRVKQNIAERQAARSGAMDASGGFDRSSMAAPVVDVRPQVLEPVRGGAGRHLDSLFDGDQQITDAEWSSAMPRESS